MIRVYNSLNIFAILGILLLYASFAFLVVYIINAFRYGSLIIPIVEIFISTFWDNIIWFVAILPLCILYSKATGYAITDEGIGLIVITSKGWKFSLFVKWEDIVKIKYKRSYLLIDKGIMIYNNAHTDKNSECLYINRSQRKFKEIVNTIIEKTNLPLQN